MIPTSEQALLLRACLWSGTAAVAAWQAWRGRVVFDDLDAGSFRLIPLLYHNLRRLQVDDPLLGRMKGIYRQTWSRNQLLFHESVPVLMAMQQAAIPVLVLKGATLAGNFYHDLGLRPMGDFDFMIPFDQTARAFEIMKQCGWKYIETVPLELTVWSSHASKWDNQNGRQIDLHWHLLPGWRLPGVDDDVWVRAAKTPIAGTDFPAMTATDLLWHVCAHGAIGDEVPSIRWVADAWMMLHDTANPVDWDQFLEAVQRRRLGFSVGCSLRCLHDDFKAPVPVRVLERLEDMPPSWLERWEQRIVSRPRGVAGALPLHCVNYLRLVRGQSMAAKISGLPLFFQRTWGASSAWQVPGCFVNKMVKRLAGQGNLTPH